MKKKLTASQKLNLFFSAFLVFAYTVCTYFVDTFSNQIANIAVAKALPLIVFFVFGLFLFYATRVGDGVPVYRFSLSVLIFMVLPGIYVLLATLVDVLPLHDQLILYGGNMTKIAVTSLGYGLPFMFISGFELSSGEESEKIEDKVNETLTEEIEEVSEDLTEDMEYIEENIEEISK